MAYTSSPSIVAVPLTTTVHRRFKHMSKHLRASMGYLGREAIIERINNFEKSLKQEQEEKKQPTYRAMKAMRSMGEASDLAPEPLGASPTVEEEPAESPVTYQVTTQETEDDLIAHVYEHHARIIIEALQRPGDKAARTFEAVQAIREEYPLLPPEENVILKRLQFLVMKLRPAKKPVEQPKEIESRFPPMRFASQLTGVEMNFKKGEVP